MMVSLPSNLSQCKYCGFAQHYNAGMLQLEFFYMQEFLADSEGIQRYSAEETTVVHHWF